MTKLKRQDLNLEVNSIEFGEIKLNEFDIPILRISVYKSAPMLLSPRTQITTSIQIQFLISVFFSFVSHAPNHLNSIFFLFFSVCFFLKIAFQLHP